MQKRVWSIALSASLLASSGIQAGVQQTKADQENTTQSIKASIDSAMTSEIYNLDSTLKTIEFQNAKTDEERSDLLEKAFLDKKQSVAQKKGLTLFLPRAAGLVAGSALIAWLSYKAWKGIYPEGELPSKRPVNKDDPYPPSPMTLEFRDASFNAQKGAAKWASVAAAGSMTALWALLGATNGPISNAGLVNLVKESFISGRYATNSIKYEDSFAEIEIKFARRYHHLKERNPLLLNSIRAKLSEMREDSIDSFMFYKRYVDTATSLPMKRGQFNFSHNSFKDYFKFYPASLRTKLASVAARLHHFSHGDQDPDLNFPIYFLGIPGSGKTHAARGLSKTLKAPFYEVTLDGATIEEVVGTEHSKEGKSDPGRLLQALTKNRSSETGEFDFSNGILFVDEFDRLLSGSSSQEKAVLSFMLKILDPTTREFYSPYLQTTVKLPSIIILAGNYAIADSALSNRFETVDFSGYDAQTKQKIADAFLVEKIAKIYGFKPEAITAQDRKAIAEMIKNDLTDGGLRSVELNLIRHFELKRLKELLNGEEI